jgi:predicted Zn-dependent protease
LKRPLALLTAAALGACCLLTCAQVRRWASTETLFTHTVAVTGDNPMALTNLGLVASHKEDYAEAERLFRAALRLEPSNIFAMGNLASLFIKQKKYDDAQAQYAQIRRVRPDSAKLFREMARAYHEQGDRRREEECLLRAVELEPASVSLHYQLALNQQSLGKTEKAVKNYAAVLRLKPGDHEASNNLAWIYATHPDAGFRDGAKAVELLRPLVAAEDCDADLVDTLAAAYAEAGQFDAALQTAENAVDRARGENKTPEAIADMQQRAALYKAHQPYRDRQLLGLPDSSRPPAAGPEKR